VPGQSGQPAPPSAAGQPGSPSAPGATGRHGDAGSPGLQDQPAQPGAGWSSSPGWSGAGGWPSPQRPSPPSGGATGQGTGPWSSPAPGAPGGPPGPNDRYGPQAYGRPDPYGAPDPYGSAEDYDPADPYGPSDPYGPEAYGRPDPYAGRDYAAPGYGAAAPGYAPPDQPVHEAYRSANAYVQAPNPQAPPNQPAPEAAPPLAGIPAQQPGPPPRPPGAHAADAGQQAPPRPGPGPAAPPEAADADGAAESAGGLTPEFLLPGRRRAPDPGWRRVLYHATGGLMRVPSSGAELRRRDMINRVRTPVAGGHHRVAILSLKGGVGKTTTTVGLGSTLASLRGDRVIAVDANPDRGTLSDKVRLETAATVRDLLNERGHIRRYADVRTFTSQAPSRLEVLASDRDPTVSVAFSDQDYGMVARVLEHYYSICLTDCGTGLLHSAMAGVLRLADQIVLVSSPSVDGARSASATLDWLAAHSYGDLVRNAVVVLSMVRPKSKSSVDLNRLEEHFDSRCRAVIKIPYDGHLEEGAEVELDLMSRPTADAYLALAAVIGDGLAMPARARRA